MTDSKVEAAETQAERLRRLYLERRDGPTQFIDAAPSLEVDTLWRGLTRGGEARLLVVRATQTVREAAARLECSADVAQLLGELMVSTLLVRSTVLNPQYDDSAKTYDLNGDNVVDYQCTLDLATPAACNYKRKVFSQLVQLRNIAQRRGM